MCHKGPLCCISCAHRADRDKAIRKLAIHSGQGRGPRVRDIARVSVFNRYVLPEVCASQPVTAGQPGSALGRHHRTQHPHPDVGPQVVPLDLQ